jgi:hypothetical protein
MTKYKITLTEQWWPFQSMSMSKPIIDWLLEHEVHFIVESGDC